MQGQTRNERRKADAAAEADGEDLRAGKERHDPLPGGVQAQSIREALGVVGDRYPGGVVEVVFPIDHEDSFVHGRAQMQAA